MLSRGFKEQIYDVNKFMPESVQCTIFSATMPLEVLEVRTLRPAPPPPLSFRVFVYVLLLLFHCCLLTDFCISKASHSLHAFRLLHSLNSSYISFSFSSSNNFHFRSISFSTSISSYFSLYFYLYSRSPLNSCATQSAFW